MCYVQLDTPSNDQTAAMRIPGLDPARRYRATEVTPGERLLPRAGLLDEVHDVDDQGPGVEVSGAALAEIGLPIAPQRPLAAAVILIQATAAPADARIDQS
jgi:hypothetical protein